MKNLKVEDHEFELLLEVFNDAISYVRKRNLAKTEKDYRRLMVDLIIQVKKRKNG